MDHEWLIGIAAQTIIFLAAGYNMVLRNDWSNRSLKEQLNAMQKQLEKLAEVITQQAVQSTRIDNNTAQMVLLQRTVEDLRRGDGFINKSD